MLGDYLTKAGVKYNDYCGTVAADAKDVENSLTQLLESKKFDFNKYLPYSIKLIFGEPFLGTPRSVYIAVSAVKKDEVASNIDELKEYAESHNNEVPAYSFSFDINPNKFFDEFKRFEIDLGYFSKCAHQYDDTIIANIIDEISL